MDKLNNISTPRQPEINMVELARNILAAQAAAVTRAEAAAEIAPNWMADTRPLLAEIAALSKQRDALAAALNKIITHASTYEVTGSTSSPYYFSDSDKEDVAREFAGIAAVALASLEVTRG